MAIVNPTITYPGSATRVSWTLANGDTGKPVYVGDLPEKTVQILGTFGAGGSVQIEGSSDGGTTWVILANRGGGNIVRTAAAIDLIAQTPLLIRANVTAGDGTTALTVIVTASEVLARETKVLAPTTGGPLFAIFGDSITEFTSVRRIPPQASPISFWRNDGYAAWMRILTDQRIRLPMGNNFGVSGDTLEMMLARIQTVISSGAQYVVVEGGTNNITNSATFASMKATWLSIIERLVAAGITPIITPILPRGDAITATQTRTQMRFNKFVEEYGLSHKEVVYVNWNKYMMDQTSAIGAPISGRMRSDNIHPGTPGGFYMGFALAEVINTIVPQSPTSMNQGVTDYFHATDNPAGNLLYTGTTGQGGLLGTGGTQTASAGLTYVGNLAAGWTAIRGTATSTATETLTKENPRTDQPSGERQIVQIATAADGGADEIYNIRYTPALADTAAGDVLFAECKIEVSAAGATQVRSLELNFFENRPANAQSSVDNGSNDNASGFLPPVTWSGTFRTEPITRQSDSTSLQLNIRARINATGAGAITFKIGDMAVRKVVDQ